MTAYTQQDIIDMLDRAGRTEAIESAEDIFPEVPKSNWPPYPDEKDQAYGWNEAENKRPVPSSRDIANRALVLAWLAKLGLRCHMAQTPRLAQAVQKRHEFVYLAGKGEILPRYREIERGEKCWKSLGRALQSGDAQAESLYWQGMGVLFKIANQEV